MPYIKQEVRPGIDAWLMLIPKVLNYGQINYIITQILLMTRPSCYEEYNALIGVLECAKQEFYRRWVAPYEDKKREINGDIW